MIFWISIAGALIFFVWLVWWTISEVVLPRFGLRIAPLAADYGSIDRLSLVEFGNIARQRGWKMDGPGLEALDLVDGLRQAAADGELQIDGRFGAADEHNKNYYPFKPIDPAMFLSHALDAPLYFADATNFGTGFRIFSGPNPGIRDLHLSNKAAALHWLETKGPQWRGLAQKKQDDLEIKRREWDKLVAQQKAEQGEPDEGR